MASYDYDVIVIGSGAGGAVAARMLAKAGKSVAIIEKNLFGGECARYACIPTKALLEAAHLYHRAKQGDSLGLRGSAIGFNFPRVKGWQQKAVKSTLVEETKQSLENDGITVVQGSAYFIDPHTITVGRARFSAKQFVIATGAETSVPTITGLPRQDFLTYKDALSLTRPPRSLAIIGGGAVGCEFASIFASFGSKVSVVEKAAHLLPEEDKEVGQALAKEFEASYDANILTHSNLQSSARRGMKKQLLLRTKGNQLHSLIVDEVLMTTGKTPVTDIGLENARVKYTAEGISVNKSMQTSAKHIYAVGDCVPTLNYTHVSLYEGRLAAHNMLHSKKAVRANYNGVPRTVFTLPEVACVGASAKELKALGVAVKSASAPLQASGKAFVSSSYNGFVKVSASQKTGKLVSASIVAPGASEMIHELALAIQAGLTPAAVASTIHAFPTWSEAIRVACSKLAKS